MDVFRVEAPSKWAFWQSVPWSLCLNLSSSWVLRHVWSQLNIALMTDDSQKHSVWSDRRFLSYQQGINTFQTNTAVKLMYMIAGWPLKTLCFSILLPYCTTGMLVGKTCRGTSPCTMILTKQHVLWSLSTSHYSSPFTDDPSHAPTQRMQEQEMSHVPSSLAFFSAKDCCFRSCSMNGQLHDAWKFNGRLCSGRHENSPKRPYNFQKASWSCHGYERQQVKRITGGSIHGWLAIFKESWLTAIDWLPRNVVNLQTQKIA